MMVVLLRDVHLRLRWNDNRRSGDDPENGKEKFHTFRYHQYGPCCPALFRNTYVAAKVALNYR